MNRALPFAALAIAAGSGPAAAHVSEQSLVLLLPTGHYIASGVISVLATIVLVSLTPPRLMDRVFTPLAMRLPQIPGWVRGATSLAACAVLLALVYIGMTGPRDPLTNLLPLSVWTGFWVTLFALAGVIGNPWTWLNPWSGLYDLLFGREAKGWLPLPERVGAWPGVTLFVLFSAFYITDPAPQDPDRLATVVLGYWAVTFAAMLVFGGQTWLARGEAFSILFDLLGRVAPLRCGPGLRVGAPGWALAGGPPLSLGLAIFALLILGMGSFDGLKETFWWLGRIGVNPLEFPGRSAVQGSSLAGMALAAAALLVAFATALWLGGRFASVGQGDAPGLTLLFRHFAPTLLPIALGYHISHFLISFLVDGQYLLAAIGDPMARGANILGLGDTRVTTGFLNTPASVKTIWLTQAAVVVAGHILSVLVSHRVALTVFATPRRAALSQIPVGAFMVAYTLFGLWLLASPRGM